MFGLSRRPSRSRPIRARQLRLEPLDERLVPSAATITGLGGRIIGNNAVVYGTVQDDSSGADTVTASGGMSGSKTTTGYFDFIAPYSGSGNVTVNFVVHDDEGFDSQNYSITLTPAQSNQAPYVTFSVAESGTQRLVTVTGKVYDESPASANVTLSGVASTSNIHPDSSGNFSVTIQATGGLGTLNVQARDMMGQLSNLAAQTVTTAKPDIEYFSCDLISLDNYRLRGHVTDEFAVGLVVTFGGDIAALRGVTVTVGADGWFEKTITLADPSQYGWVTADLTDWWNVAADTESAYLAQ